MTYTVEILDDHALNLLRELEQMKVIRLSAQHQKEQQSTATTRKKEFKAIRLDTQGFKFNREEANER